ncbi:MAG TPA: fructosamine kinase family protein [Ignavibacteriaceae bacterium]|nr:fructosamine kinase family protein [Ignavibacteriaceae bacterium]
MKLNSRIESIIEKETGSGIKSVQSLSGGCISNAYKLEFNSGLIAFLKMNPDGSMFRKEADGLVELGKANAIRVPKVIFCGDDFILLEYINEGRRSKTFFEDFGAGFARLHEFTGDHFGFYEDNYIGSTVQMNIPVEKEKLNWIEFYLNKRILFQFKLAEKNGYSSQELHKGIKKLESKIGEILSGSEEPPALLHGDLWSGNYITDEKGNACLIDPAVYYGHREADLAMTKLFGGFTREFYYAYNECFPLKPGYEYRENIYKLYHVLNHLNLFGTGYYSHALQLVRSYL